jgi:HK97 family phage portal protein
VSAVYRAVELRAKTEAQFAIQYQRKNKEGGNFMPDMWGPGKTINYLLQVQPNPISTAASLIEQVVIRRLLLGNAFIYIERDEWKDPMNLWLAECGGYDEITGTYTLTYLGENGVRFKVNAPRRDVLHFANTFRYQNGFWGISTIKYAYDTLSLIKTESNQSLETAAKGGRVKLIIGEQPPASGYSPISQGLFDPKQMKQYAQEVNEEIYKQDVVSLRGLDKVQNISMSAQDMQLMEHMNMGLDDVARFFGTPRPLLMLDTNSHYTTYTNATLEYLQRTVQPDITEMEQEMNRKLLTRDDFGKRRIHMCEQPLLRLDKEAQAKVDKMQLETGAATVNEIRQQYDRPAVEGGDIIYVSTNLAELGSQKLSGAQPTPAQTEPNPEEK